MKKIKALFIFSVIINLILLAYIIHSERNDLNAEEIRIEKDNHSPGKELEAMNKVYVPNYKNICNNKKGKTFKILIIGNSISYHGIAKEIGWNYISGMAASSQ